MVVVFFLCVGMTFIPVALGMMRNHQPTHYAPTHGHEDTPTQPYPMMPYGRGGWSGHPSGRGVLVLLPMLTCVVFPLLALLFAGVHLARRHAWQTAQTGGPMPPWMRKHGEHHQHDHGPTGQPSEHCDEETKATPNTKNEREATSESEATA